MRTLRTTSERGVALVVALFSMVVIGALVAGAFFVGRVEQVTGYNTVWAAQAGEAAEAGVGAVIATVEVAQLDPMPVYSEASPVELTLPTGTIAGMPSLTYNTSIRRLNLELFMVRSTGQRASPGGQVMASQSLAQLIRIARPTFSVNSAVTVQSPINFNGNSFAVTGMNGMPAGWTADECDGGPLDSNEDDVVGIRSATTVGGTAKELENVEGYPASTVDYDPTITSETFKDFMDYTYNTLAGQPGVKTLPSTSTYTGVAPVVDATTSPAVCDKTVLLNLGEPYRNPPEAGAVTECNGYFPTAHGTGSSTKFAAGTRGQGILLIDGDLELVGGFEWSGIVLVKGQMKITGTGNKIHGAILTEGVDVTSSGSIGGNAQITFSRCAIAKAVQGASTPVPLARGWTQLY